MSDDETADDLEFRVGRGLAMAVHEWALIYWGERCPDYDPDCPCCAAWDGFDDLFDGLEL